jgi:hypothetical protein
MYMMAIMAMLVALVGTYTQIYTKQVASGITQQSNVVSSMMQWHTTAVSFTTYFLKQSSILPLGQPVDSCTLTRFNTGAFPSGLTQCQYNNGAAAATAFVGMSTAGTVPLCRNPIVMPCLTPLPQGYSPNYIFHTVAFNDGALPPNTHYYVLTYVPPPSPNAYDDTYKVGFLCLPGPLANDMCRVPPNVRFPMAFDTLYKQMAKNPLLSPVGYGTITNSTAICSSAPSPVLPPCLVTPTFPSVNGGALTNLKYRVPSNTVVPPGSIGLITEIFPCTGC